MADRLEPTDPPDPPVLRRALKAADTEERALAREVRRHIARSALWTVPALGLVGLLGGSRMLLSPVMLGATLLFVGVSVHAYLRPLRHTYLLRRDRTSEVLAANGLPETPGEADASPAQRRLAVLELIDELEIASGGTRRSTRFGRWVTRWSLRLFAASTLATAGVGLAAGAWGLAGVGGLLGVGAVFLSRRVDAGERRREEALALLRDEVDALELGDGPAPRRI